MFCPSSDRACPSFIEPNDALKPNALLHMKLAGGRAGGCCGHWGEQADGLWVAGGYASGQGMGGQAGVRRAGGRAGMRVGTVCLVCQSICLLFKQRPREQADRRSVSLIFLYVRNF